MIGRAGLAAALLLAALLLAAAPAAAAPLEIRVVVVTTFEEGKDEGDKPGELQDWVERFPLPDRLSFPQGTRDLRYNPDAHVLGIVTGEGKSHAAASIMGLAMDPRFDVSRAYWLLAGIGGIDPAVGSIGSAAWAGYVVDGDLAYEIDAREVPADWPTGIVPYDRATPYEAPTPPESSVSGDQVYRLNDRLVDWAVALTKPVGLPDNPRIQAARALYAGFPNAQRPPFVLKGDTLTCDRFWIGTRMTDWAHRWVAYWTGGKGVSATSAEEDSGYMEALTMLARAHRVDRDRVLDLRTASDFTLPPPGTAVTQFLAAEAHGDYAGYGAAIEAAYLVGSRVVKELAGHWERYAAQPPAP